MTTILEIKASHLRNNDRNVHEKLFGVMYGPLCHYAQAILRDSDEAEDIVQQLFYKLWDQRNELEIHTSIKSYLYRAVHNSCLNRVQQLKTRAEHQEHYAYARPTTTENTTEKLIHSELEQQIAEAIDKLPPKCKKVFEMSRLEYLSYSEIAQKLGISTNTVENHIAKALRLLRESLKDALPFFLAMALFLN